MLEIRIMARKEIFSSSNTRLFIILGIIAFAIIIGTIMGATYRERFTQRIRLAFLSMKGCPHCITFNETWDKMKVNPNYNDIKFEKYDLNDPVDPTATTPQTYAEKYNVQAAPTILLLSPVVKEFAEDSRDEDTIIRWVRRNIN